MLDVLINAVKNYPYFVPFIMFFMGFYIMIADANLIKKVIGLNLIQGAVIVFYLLVAYIDNSVPPIFKEEGDLYANPLPHVLMLTAIVVGIATTALAFALIYVIYKNYKTINEQEIMSINIAADKQMAAENNSINETNSK